MDFDVTAFGQDFLVKKYLYRKIVSLERNGFKPQHMGSDQIIQPLFTVLKFQLGGYRINGFLERPAHTGQKLPLIADC